MFFIGSFTSFDAQLVPHIHFISDFMLAECYFAVTLKHLTFLYFKYIVFFIITGHYSYFGFHISTKQDLQYYIMFEQLGYKWPVLTHSVVFWSIRHICQVNASLFLFVFNKKEPDRMCWSKEVEKNFNSFQLRWNPLETCWLKGRSLYSFCCKQSKETSGAPTWSQDEGQSKRCFEWNYLQPFTQDGNYWRSRKIVILVKIELW